MRRRLVVAALVLAVCAGCSSAPPGVTLPPLTSSAVSTAAASPASQILETLSASPPESTVVSSSASDSEASTSEASGVTEVVRPAGRVDISIPDAIQGADRESALAAIDAFGRAMDVADQALADPSAKDWTIDIGSYWVQEPRINLITAVSRFLTDGWKQAGRSEISGVVTSVNLNIVNLATCFDSTAQSIIDSKGATIIAGQGRGRIDVEISNFEEPAGWHVNSRLEPAGETAC